MTKPVKTQFPLIQGNVQLLVSREEGEGVFLHADGEGLLSLAGILTKLAEVDQRTLPPLPNEGASEHVHLEPDFDLSASSTRFTIGRLDDKRGQFDETFRPRKRKRLEPIVNRWYQA
jgi:hypothetical protein